MPAALHSSFCSWDRARVSGYLPHGALRALPRCGAPPPDDPALEKEEGEDGAVGVGRSQGSVGPEPWQSVEEGGAGALPLGRAEPAGAPGLRFWALQQRLVAPTSAIDSNLAPKRFFVLYSVSLGLT